MKKITLALILILGLVQSNAQLSNGLIAKYYFTSGNTNDDLGQRNAINHGATLTACRFGHSNHAYRFDGTGSYISLPADYWVTGNFSASGWVMLDSNTNFCRFFEFGNGINASNVFFAFNTGGNPTPNFTMHDSNGSYYRVQPPFGSSFPMHTWQHVVITLQGYNVIIYLNNTVWATGTFPFLPGNVIRSMCYLGKSNFGAQDGPFKGVLDDIRFYNRALTANEVDSLFKETPCSPSAGINTVQYTAGNIVLCPNPCTNLAYLSTANREQIASVYLFNNTGTLIKKFLPNADNLTLDVSNFASGIYFARVTTASGNSSCVRLLKQ